MNADLESMIAMIARVLSVKILRVALNAFVSKALLEMEDLATFLVRKKKFQKIITSRTNLSFIIILADESLCNSTCEQHCYRSRDGTYNCACDSGYYLASDHISCIGKCAFFYYVFEIIVTIAWYCRY